MENGIMNGDDRSLTRSSSRGSMNRDSYGRTSLLRRNQSLSAKQISFYRNGDKFFRGLKLAVSAERYKEWDSLLAELSSKLDLPTGAVRYVFCSETGKMITDVNELQYGVSYVCSSSASFRDVEGGYGKENHPQWSLHNKKALRDELNNWTDPKGTVGEEDKISHGPRDFIKPKLVTVIKPGKPPQKKVTMLLNTKTAASLNQVLDHLSAKGTLGKVDRLYTAVTAKQIRTLRDLFDDDICFVALSSNERPPEEGFDLEIQRNLPPWKVSVVKKTPYIPGLRPECLPPNKQFTVHLHCILDALSSPEPQTPRRPKSSRGMPISPRLYTPKKQYNKPLPRPATAPSQRPRTAIGMRTPELTRKSLTTTRMTGDIKSAFKGSPTKSKGSPEKAVSPVKPKAGSDKPIAIKPRPRPKAGSITPVAIRRPPKIPQVLVDYDDEDKQSIDSNENVEARHGYYVYIDGVKVYTNQAPTTDGKPTASVKPMIAADFKESKTEIIEEFEKDLKPLVMADLDSGDPVEAGQ